MAQFTADSIERVKESADIVEVVSAHTDLRRSGTRFSGLCPFHDERTPSFSVDPAGKLYHCFGCGVGGDVIKFVEEKEGLSFPDAVEALADRYGVELERTHEDPQAEERRKRRARLRELLERTATFYVSVLWDSPQAEKARKYLAGRGLGEGILREFGVGVAPGPWDTVLMRGQKAGYSVAELEAAGLVQRSQKQRGHYDRFRSRIVFPIRDARGQMQGFGARALLPDQQPKYVNSPEGELYKKRDTLFGVNRASPSLRRFRRAVVVEGYTDVLACHQAGFEDVVAVMGTAITQEQLGELARLSDEVILALDADRSGREAMLRAQRVPSGKEMRLRIARMPEGKDPAEFLTSDDRGQRDQAAEQYRKALEDAEELSAFHMRTLLDDADLLSAAGRDRALKDAAPVVASVRDPLSQAELSRELADRLNADPRLVAQLIANAVGQPAAAQPNQTERKQARRDAGQRSEPPGPRPLSPREWREKALLALCVASPQDGHDLIQRLTDDHLSSPVAKRALAWLGEHLEEPTAGLPRDDEELVSFVTEVAMQAEREPAGRDAMELNFLELERALVEDRIAAVKQGGGELPVELQRRRGELAERIAHFESA